MRTSKGVRPPDRGEKIIRAFRRGKDLNEIAAQLGITRQAVRSRLIKSGVEFEDDDRFGLWNMSDDKRREAIAQRASRGARERLKALR